MADGRGAVPAGALQGRNHGVTIDFGSGGTSLPYCRWGWSQPEPEYTWTLGRNSRLEIPRPDQPATYAMLLELRPFLWPGLPGQRLVVYVNHRQVGNFLVSANGPFECELPWDLIADTATITVTFVHLDAARPCEVVDSTDDRDIALAFERVSLVPLIAAGASTPIPVPGPILPPQQLLMAFESLGENCEFGLAQRRCGAEPLDLLRFASAPLPELVAALRGRFVGLGEPGNLDIRLAGGEYLVIDRCYGLLYHSWCGPRDAEPEEICRREQRHLPFLRDKLVRDLEEGRKIFVYHGMEPLSRACALQLLLALRSYGPATLLWVERQQVGHPAGSVEWVAPGLAKGYMDRFAPGDDAHDLSIHCWLALCRAAYRLITGDSGSPSPTSAPVTTSA